MTTQQKLINRLIKPFAGKWIALSKDEKHVISVANTAHAAFNKAKKKGEDFPHLIKAPDSSIAALIY